MNKRILKIWVVLVVGMTGIGTAQGKSVETFHEEFRLNTGKEWIDATAEEKRSFVQDYYHKKEEAVRGGKERLHYGEDEVGPEVALNIESTLEVERLFKQKMKKSWEEATSEEQEVFLKEHEKGEEKKRQAQIEQEKRRVEEEKRQKQLKEREKKELKRLEERRKQDALKEKERREKEREQSQEKLMDALEELQKKRPYTQDRRR